MTTVTVLFGLLTTHGGLLHGGQISQLQPHVYQTAEACLDAKRQMEQKVAKDFKKVDLECTPTKVEE